MLGFWGFWTRALAPQQDFVAFCRCSLRFLNASANKLETLPPATLSEETSSILQELYLTNNNLTDKCVPLLTGHPHLKILHMAYNRLQSFPARWKPQSDAFHCVSENERTDGKAQAKMFISHIMSGVCFLMPLHSCLFCELWSPSPQTEMGCCFEYECIQRPTH